MRAYLIACIIFFVPLIPCSSLPSTPAEQTYSITLTKKAEAGHNIYEVGDRKVFADVHEVKKGEYLWKIMRDKGLLGRPDFPALFKALKELNKSFNNLDLIHPGDKILIPLKITPLRGLSPTVSKLKEQKVSPAELKDIDFEQYTVAPGDNIVKVVTGKYDIPAKQLYGQYMEMLKKLNPHIKDINSIYPGQVIRLPIFSPKVVRKPIQAPPKPTGTKVEEAGHPNPFAKDLRAIFVAMGEEWIQSGEHFIPLRSGGQIDLKAASFPLINVVSGTRVIVDLGNKLPPKMARLIEDTWGEYRVVHLLPSDDLKTALDKILSSCGYPKVLRKGQGITIGDDVLVHLKGDWVVERGGDPSHGWGTVVINILNDQGERTNPWMVNFLEGLGIRVIDHPSLPSVEQPPLAESVLAIGTVPALAETLLDMLGVKFSTGVDIPIYGSKRADFNLIIKADFFFRHNGMDAIVDLGSLDHTLISFLEEHRFKVLSLKDQKDLFAGAKQILTFLGYPYREGPHEFWASAREHSRNIRIEIPGISFSDFNGRNVLAIPFAVTPELASFLHYNGYRIIALSISPRVQ